MLERYLKEASAENSSEPIIKAAIELAAFTVKEGPVALCSCLSFFIAANKRLKQEIRVLQQEIEEFKKQCSCQGLATQQTIAPLLPVCGKTEQSEDGNGLMKRLCISQDINSTGKSRRTHQQSAPVGSSVPSTQGICVASPKHLTTSSDQNHCDARSLSSRASSIAVCHVPDTNDRLCWPHNTPHTSTVTSSAQLASAAPSLASGQSLLTVVAQVHTSSSSTQSLHEPSEENEGSVCCWEQTCDQLEESEVVSPLPLLGCLCKACQYLLQDPTSAAFTLNDDAEEDIVVPGNRVVVEAYSSSVAPMQHNGSQVVTVVYFGHDRETLVPRDPLQSQPVGVVALFEDGVERFVPLSRVMYHLSDEEDEGDSDGVSTRSLSPQLAADMTPRASPQPETDDITPEPPCIEGSSRAETDQLLSTCISTYSTADSTTPQHHAVAHSLNPNVGSAPPVFSLAVDRVVLDQHVPLDGSTGSHAYVPGMSSSSNKLNLASSVVPAPLHSSMDAASNDVVTLRAATLLRRSLSDSSCNDGASSTASHSLECLSLCAGDTGRYLSTSSDSGQWTHIGYENAGYNAAQDELAKPQIEDTDGGCNDQRYHSSSEAHPSSGTLRNDVRLDLHDVSLYESSDSAICISFANSQQSSFWSTTSSLGRPTFRSLNVGDCSAGSKSQFVGQLDTETSEKNCVTEPASLNCETSGEKHNPGRTKSTAEDSGTDILNRALNVFRRRNSALDIYHLQNVSNV